MPASFVDVNVLLALASRGHTHHGYALDWVLRQPERSVGICRLAQLGFLRLLNTPKILGSDALPADACWNSWQKILAFNRFEFLALEPPGLDMAFAGYLQNKQYEPSLWTDAYLAAFAQASGLSLVSFDRGFALFPGLRHEILSSQVPPL